MNEQLAILDAKLSLARHIAIITHVKPDGDALGSALALSQVLEQKGYAVVVIIPTLYPSFLAWMPGSDKIINADEYTRPNLIDKIGPIDILFCLDCSVIDRLQKLDFMVKKTDVFKVVIDHHMEPANFADLLFWDVEASSTAELLFSMLKSWGKLDMVNRSISTCLYAGIVTDTNLFKNANTTSKTHAVVAELMKQGIDIAMIHHMIYGNKSLNHLLFLSFAIQERLVILSDLHAAYFFVKKEDYVKYNLYLGDTEGLINYALALKNIKFAAVLKEREDMVDLSFRSIGKSSLSANSVAKTYFHGGGHKNAAGGVSTSSLEVTIDRLKKILQQLTEKNNELYNT